MSKPAAIRASKENARKAKKLVARLVTDGRALTEKEGWFLNEFIDRTIGRLPTEAAYKADAERRAAKSKKS